MKKVVTTIIIGMCAVAMTAVAGDVGGKPYAFTSLGVDAKGPTYRADATDAEGAFYNPSMLAFGENASFSVFAALPFSMGGASVDNVYYGSVSGAFARGMHSFGLNVISLVNSGLSGFDDAGNATGTFGASEYALTVSYAHPVGKYFSVGGALTGIGQFIGDYTALNAYLTASASFRLDRVALSLNMKNIFSTDLFTQAEEQFPFEASLALSYAPYEFWKMYGTLEYTPGYAPTFSLATEVMMFGMMYLRLAYDFSGLVNVAPVNTFGTGAVLSTSATYYPYRALDVGVGFDFLSRYTLDYTVSIHNELGITHALGLRVSLDPVE